MPTISTSICSHLHYSISGSGRAIVLLHGFPESNTIWDNIVPALNQKFTIIIPDLPGCGSSTLDRETSIVDMAKCIKAILEHEKIYKVVMGGHSMGGYVAFAFATMYSESVAGLSIIHSTPLADDDEKKIARQKSIEIIRAGGKRNFVSQMIPNLFSIGFKQSNPAIVQHQIERSLLMNGEAMINCYKAMMERESSTQFLEKATIPVQWIHGQDDMITPYKKTLQYSFKTSVNFVSLYPSCGHMSMLESPNRLSADLNRFIDFCYFS